MFKTITLILIVIVGAVIGMALSKPDTFRVERAITIKASPEKIFALINDFHQWVTWSPWEKLDPTMQRTHSGAENGQGAIYAWKGNNQVGQGSMEILASTPPSKVLIKLDFIQPFESHNQAEFTLIPKDDMTEVTWTMSGPNTFIGRVMSVFVSMDTMIGKDFESGLNNMKMAAEK
ncbi:SRPBCC family protein [Ampullimonas aquatilis]|uniref:SRPBCC family protein n=1 Tax=Ampullimonas aquatilis TaxID=1341549 RepID=UPI003C70CBF0